MGSSLRCCHTKEVTHRNLKRCGASESPASLFTFLTAASAGVSPACTQRECLSEFWYMVHLQRCWARGRPPSLQSLKLPLQASPQPAC